MKTEDPRRALGAAGEAAAARALEASGHRIVARNVRAGGVELDLVVTKGHTIAFVEVKTRRSGRAGAPEEAVDARKCARLVRGARAFLREHGARGRRVRFDVVSVVPDARGALVATHRPGAFDAGDAAGGRDAGST
ncbi:MAG TPA: YraN family protein [Myxococcota bacterium]|nr:YraN family protein [Myxococcota bacterium]